MPSASLLRKGWKLGCVLAFVLVPAACNQPRNTPPPETAAAVAVDNQAPVSSDALEVTVYKGATCPCCVKWVEHLETHGFKVTTHDVDDLNAVKTRHHVGEDLASCHTALVGGYIVEGHVPADLIKRLLSDRPRIAGIAVPGMPAGSPGMEVGFTEAYDVLAFDSTGKVTGVYARR